jgi:LytS/YehU family sensor histidine kinase
VTVRTELGFIESYSFLLKIRFENKFSVDIQLPENILDKYKIAPLTLQLLIENAVKHNRMSVNEPLVVTISFEEDQMLIVKNKLQPRSTPAMSTGVGLQNIMNRYALLTKRPVWAGEADDQFVVKIPLINEPS